MEELQIVEAADPLAMYRAEVAAEKDSTARKMSPAAAAKLAAQNEADKQRKAADKRFAADFTRLIHDERLVVLLNRISPGQTWGEKNLLKLRRCLAHGWEPTCPNDVLFFATLTSDEEAISYDQFYREMTHEWPTPPAKDGVELADCKAGKKCMGLNNRRPRQAPKGQFCSNICRQSYLAVQRRAKAGVQSVN